MRLINLKTLGLETFLAQTPPYVILSHTWGPDELTLQEFNGPESRQSAGLTKILNFCKTIQSQLSLSVEHCWIDTCCIDKTSSAELSEAINSMFRWYRQSHCCYAFLSDVEYDTADATLGSDFEKSRWFTRGFTLQELLAPLDVFFFDVNWRYIGSKASLTERISAITRIPQHMLRDRTFELASVAQKMSWAAKRQTTRPEDVAYCLLGIFGVNMPLLYGEGSKAFTRLQEEILKGSEDQSIFAWDAFKMMFSQLESVGALAPSPEYFERSGNISALPFPVGGEASTSSKGISIRLPLEQGDSSDLALLSCLFDGDLGSRVAISVRQDPSDETFYAREALALKRVNVSSPDKLIASTQRITLGRGNRFIYPSSSGLRCLIRYSPGGTSGWRWKSSHPESMPWVHAKESHSLSLDVPRSSTSLFDALQVTHVFERHVPPLQGVRVGLELCLKGWQPDESWVNLVDLKSEKADGYYSVLRVSASSASLDWGDISLTARVEHFYAYDAPMVMVTLEETWPVEDEAMQTSDLS